MSGPKQWLSQMKLESEVLKLRRQALELARSCIEQDPQSEGMTPDEIEFAACELCDRQVKEITELQKENTL